MNNEQALGGSVHRWRRPVPLVLFLCILAVACYAGYRRYQAAPADKRLPSEAVQTQAAPRAPLEFAPIDIALVEMRGLERKVAFSGTLVPVVQSMVKSTVGGEVLRVSVREGEWVKRGQVIAEIDTADLRSRLEAAVADQEERRSRLAIALHNRDSNKALLEQNFISKSGFEQIASTLKGSEAAVQWADAQVKLAQKALLDATIRSPMDGWVAKRLVSPGERVQPDGAILSVVDLTQLELEATIPASDVPAISIGQAVRFRVNGFAERPFEGRLDRINPQTEAGSRAIKLFVTVANKDVSLRGGMFAQGNVSLSRSDPVPSIPVSAVFEEAGQSYVFSIEASKLVKRAVVLGERGGSDGMVGVRSGLPVGVPVVRVRMNGLKAGEPAVILPSLANPTNPTNPTKPA